MKGKNMADKYVVGVYRTESGAASAVRRLLEIGYDSDDISVLAKYPERFAMLSLQTDVVVASPTQSAAGAGAGAAAGARGGLLLGLGTLVIPGIGPFLAAGPLAAALGGAIAGGVTGGFLGALVGMGIEKSEAALYEEALSRGDLLVLVQADHSRYDRVQDIFLSLQEEEEEEWPGPVIDPLPSLA